MVASIINAVAADRVARGEAEAPPEEVPHTHPHAREPLDEQTRKRLAACLRFPTTLPAGHA